MCFKKSAPIFIQLTTLIPTPHGPSKAGRQKAHGAVSEQMYWFWRGRRWKQRGILHQQHSTNCSPTLRQLQTLRIRTLWEKDDIISSHFLTRSGARPSLPCLFCHSSVVLFACRSGLCTTFHPLALNYRILCHT